MTTSTATYFVSYTLSYWPVYPSTLGRTSDALESVLFQHRHHTCMSPTPAQISNHETIFGVWLHNPSQIYYKNTRAIVGNCWSKLQRFSGLSEGDFGRCRYGYSSTHNWGHFLKPTTTSLKVSPLRRRLHLRWRERYTPWEPPTSMYNRDPCASRNTDSIETVTTFTTAGQSELQIATEAIQLMSTTWTKTAVTHHSNVLDTPHVHAT